MAKRTFDVILAVSLLLLFALPMMLLSLFIKLTSHGPVIHWSDRVGRDNEIFRMPKFRTMRNNTPQLPTHLLPNPDNWLTPIGRFLRKTSVDELPQLWSILVGQMAFVGPRPALFNQCDLIELRTQLGVHRLTPGLTGWAQVNGRDELPIPDKVRYDNYYAQHVSLRFDLAILTMTAAKVLRGTGIREGSVQADGLGDPSHQTRAA